MDICSFFFCDFMCLRFFVNKSIPGWCDARSVSFTIAYYMNTCRFFFNKMTSDLKDLKWVASADLC